MLVHIHVWAVVVHAGILGRAVFAQSAFIMPRSLVLVRSVKTLKDTVRLHLCQVIGKQQRLSVNLITASYLAYHCLTSQQCYPTVSVCNVVALPTDKNLKPSHTSYALQSSKWMDCCWKCANIKLLKGCAAFKCDTMLFFLVF